MVKRNLSDVLARNLSHHIGSEGLIYLAEDISVYGTAVCTTALHLYHATYQQGKRRVFRGVVQTDLRKPSGLARRSFDVKNMSKNQQSTSITVDQSGPHNVQSGNTECV